MNPMVLLSLLFPLVSPLPYPDADHLVELLDSWDHDHRTCAEHALRSCGPLVEGNLEWASLYHPGPAVRQVAGRLLAELDCLPTVPWIDLPGGPNALAWVFAYLSAARERSVFCGAPDWPDYRLATVLLMRDLRRAGVPQSRRLDLLSYMEVREAEWRSRYRPSP